MGVPLTGQAIMLRTEPKVSAIRFGSVKPRPTGGVYP